MLFPFFDVGVAWECCVASGGEGGFGDGFVGGVRVEEWGYEGCGCVLLWCCGETGGEVGSVEFGWVLLGLP